MTLSLGGATGGAGFQSDSQASTFADNVWNLFMGGSSSTRPFGDAVLDGIDLDIEGGGSNCKSFDERNLPWLLTFLSSSLLDYGTFLTKLRSYFSKANKKYYVTAAPQCVYPDANLGATISQNSIDAIYVQFCKSAYPSGSRHFWALTYYLIDNNPCGLQTWGTSGWNYGVWDYWAKNISPNKDIKVYIGAPASPTAAGGGYVPVNTLSTIALSTRQSFPSFGGVMFWGKLERS